jgi:serine/threonine protein kinase
MADEQPTPTYPQPDGTPTYHGAAPTRTDVTPDDYQPPTPPAPPTPDDHDPPRAERFANPAFHRKGGMGRVFAADDRELSRRVAVKDIQPKHRDKDWYRRKFVFEAEVTGELEHPGIVPVYTLRRPAAADDHPHYAMRFVEGETLAAAIKAFHAAGPTAGLTGDQSVALRRLLARFLTVCQTIAYAHSRRIIHRDLKPDNIMLGPFGETLVVDWGLAKRLTSGETAAAEAPLAGAAATTGGGTPGYWSPEQADKDGPGHDERTDVYGLGAVLYAVLTGRSPHPSGRHAAEPPRPRAASPWVDAVLDDITARALALAPADRYPSAADLAAAVERWMADQPAAAQWATVAVLRDRSAADPADAVLLEQLARQLSNLGQVYQGMGRAGDAIRAIGEAADLFRDLFARFPQTPRFRAERANCFLAAAPLHAALGAAEEAQRLQAEAAEIYRGLIATHPGEYKQNLATIIITRELPAPSVTLAPDEPPTGATFGLSAEVSTDAAAAPPADVPEPELVQGYTVQRVLGVGGSGRVLLARDNALRRLVAIKEFTQEFTGVRGQRFLREIQLTANLRHPNIVQVYTYGIHSGTGRPFLVMEYVEGQSLQEETRRFHASPTPMTPGNSAFARLLTAFVQACDALGYAHANKIAHRDAKPANVIVQPDGAAVVIDWGIAKGFAEARDLAAEDEGDEAFSASMTRTGVIVGTPAYIAPEQIKGVVRASAALDVYTLGVGLFEILTGRTPFAGTSALEIMLQKAKGGFDRPGKMNPGVPVGLERVCLKAMAREPADRYATAAELGADVTAWLRAAETGSLPPVPQPGSRTRKAIPPPEPPTWGGRASLPRQPAPPPPRGGGNPLSRLWAWLTGR